MSPKATELDSLFCLTASRNPGHRNYELVTQVALMESNSHHKVARIIAGNVNTTLPPFVQGLHGL